MSRTQRTLLLQVQGRAGAGETNVLLAHDSRSGDGAAVLVISSEMEEVLRLSDRVIVMRNGRVAAQLPRKEATEENIMRAASLSN